MFLDNNFWKDWPINLIFDMLVGHFSMWVKFEYHGHGQGHGNQKLTFSLCLADTISSNWPIDLIFGMLVGHYHI